MEQHEIDWEERIIPNDQVNMAALLAFLPLSLLAALPFSLIHGMAAVGLGFKSVVDHPLRLLAVLIGSVFVHEGLHALGWALFGRVSLKEMKFGILMGNPYTHVKVPLRGRAYQWGAALPGIVLGVVPALISWINGSGVLMLYAATMLATAAGDAIMLWLLRDLPPKQFVKDHPSAIGCLVEKE